MDDFRSKSYNDSTAQADFANATDGSNGYDYSRPAGTGFRCYSASYASCSSANNDNTNNTQIELSGREIKSRKGNYISKSWSFSDPELQRKKRVASYKVYTVEGKVKGSLKKSFRWIKDRCTKVVYGWR